MTTVNSFAEYCAYIKILLEKSKNDQELFEAIVNAPFHNKLYTTSLDLGMIVLVLNNLKTQVIERIAYSQTPSAIDAVKASPIAFHTITIPLKHKENITAKAIQHNKYYKTSDWHYIFTPALSAEAARFNQAEAGVGCSYVYPLSDTRDGGALIFGFYQTIDMIHKEHRDFMKNYSQLAASYLTIPA